MSTFVFPGQGSQFQGMTNDFYDNYVEARDIFHLISDTTQIDIKDMIKAGVGLNIISALVVSILSIFLLNLFFGLQITSIPDWALSGKIN